jgi:hypothetical protein
MALCPGTRASRHNQRCGLTLYRCKKCGNVECQQTRLGECTNAAFISLKCQKCGESSSSQREVFR